MEDQMVYLDDNTKNSNNGFYTNKYGELSICSLNQKIREYIDKVYGRFGFEYGENKDIIVNGKIINTEYISKMVNNYTVFKTFIRENNIKSENEFYSSLISNFYDVYHYDGVFFREQTLPILINTTRKGNKNEEKCKKVFLEHAKSKGLDIDMEDPTIEEDIQGIDAKFFYKNKYLKIQIKPFTDMRYEGDNILLKSNGSLSVGLIDYLMLYKDDNYIILKNNLESPIKIKGDTFISHISNISLRLTKYI
jgi:hypothetical protein